MGRRAHALVAFAAVGRRCATIEVDGASVWFTLVEHEECWAAVADIGQESVTIAARALQYVSYD